MADPISTMGHWLEVLERYQSDGGEIAIGIAQENEYDWIRERNVDNLRQSGEDSRGKEITPSYSQVTVRIKRAKRQEFRHVTLRDTGSFHRSIYPRFRSDRFELEATDPKTAKLQAKYGKAILGLQSEDIDELVDRLRPQMIEQFQDELIG